MSEKDICLRFGISTHARKLSVREMSVGSFSNDDGDGNENVKKVIGLLSKTTTLHVHHAFLYISLPLLHDYDVKMPSFTFYGGRKTSDDKLFFLFLNLSAVPKKSTPGKLAYISYFQRIEISATRLEKTPIHFKSDIFAAVTLCRCQKSLVSTVVSALRQTTCQKVAKESALFVHDKRGEQISVDITS